MENTEDLLLRARHAGLTFRFEDGAIRKECTAGGEEFHAALSHDQIEDIDRHLQSVADDFFPHAPATGTSLQQNLSKEGLEKLNSGFSNIVVAMHLSGHVREDDVANALQLLVASQSSLRTRYAHSAGRWTGTIAPQLEVELEVVHSDQELDDGAITQVLAAHQDWCYSDPDFSRETLAKARLVSCRGSAILFVVLAHFIADGFSEGVICDHFRRFLNVPADRWGTLDLPVSSYDALVRRQGRLIVDASIQAHAAKLAAQLAGAKAFAIPERYRSEESAGVAAVPLLSFDAESLKAMRDIARLGYASENFVVTSLLTFALADWSGQRRFILPSIYHGRGMAEDFTTVGMFMVPVGMVVDADPDLTVRENMARLFAAWAETTRFGGVAAWRAMQGAPVDRTLLLNFAQESGEAEPGAAATGVTIAKLPMRPKFSGDLTGVGLYFLTMQRPEGVVTTLFANQAVVSAAGTDELRRRVQQYFASYLEGGADAPLSTLAGVVSRA